MPIVAANYEMGIPTKGKYFNICRNSFNFFSCICYSPLMIGIVGVSFVKCPFCVCLIVLTLPYLFHESLFWVCQSGRGEWCCVFVLLINGYTSTRGTPKRWKLFGEFLRLLPSDNTSLRTDGCWFPLPFVTIQLTQPLLNQQFFHSQHLQTYPCLTDLVPVLTHQKGKQFCFVLFSRTLFMHRRVKPY